MRKPALLEIYNAIASLLGLDCCCCCCCCSNCC